ncbi:MAG: hypothetical protein GF364_19480 [Candidatus Lokiarchaeota archaeon]|nr:hypothetical protein [Candidatus Lokiarchaeota archaeon]
MGKLNKKEKIGLLVFILAANVALILGLDYSGLGGNVSDVDRLPDGSTLVTNTDWFDIITFQHLNPQRIYKLDANNEVVWEYWGTAFPHEIILLETGNYLCADTAHERAFEIDPTDNTIVWEWKPENINWTKVNPAWGEDHYYNNPIGFDWTHLNDIEIRDFGTYNACLISIRNFDLVVEVNYTADKEFWTANEDNDPDNVIWWYGDRGNYDLVNHQHNPDYIDDDSIIIADSKNDRIIIVNKTTKEITWEYGDEQGANLDWPRDADLLPNGNLLITDSFHHRVFEMNMTTLEIEWEFSKILCNAYEADLLPNGHILIGDITIIELDENLNVVWRYGISFPQMLIYLNFGFIALLELRRIIQLIRRGKKQEWEHDNKSNHIKWLVLYSVGFSLSILFIIYYNVIYGIIGSVFFRPFV